MFEMKWVCNVQSVLWTPLSVFKKIIKYLDLLAGYLQLINNKLCVLSNCIQYRVDKMRKYLH